MNFYDAVKNRRTNYTITNKSSISDERIEQIIRELVQYTPSAFHSQSSRVVLLLGDKHKKLWEIVMKKLQAIVPKEAFATSETKINSFAAGYGTILYFEDCDVVKALQDGFPIYKEHFPTWSNQSSGMLQCNIWTALAQEGLAASVQHYNPIIDEQVAKEFGIPANWKLNAQMPFGIADSQPGALEYKNLADRVLVLQ